MNVEDAMAEALNLLVIEDVLADFLLLERHLQRRGLEARCRRVDSTEALAACLADSNWDAVLSDFHIPAMDFSRNLALIRSRVPHAPIILVSGTIGEERAVELLKSGVTDFVLKENLTRLVPALERALREAAEHRARKEAEQALREKDELLRDVSALARIGGWTFEPATGSGTWTEEITRICDLPPSIDIDSPHAGVFLREGGRQKFEAALAQAVESGKPFALELDIVTGEGNRKWVRVVGAPLVEAGRVVKVRGSMQDITDRKQSEIVLFEQKERAQVTLQSIADAVITTDAKGVIDYMNPVAEQLMGRTLDAAVGQALPKVLELIDERQERPMPNPLWVALSEGRPHRLPADCLLVRPDGSRSAVENSAAPIRGRDGQVIGGVLVLHDVTESREITAQMAHQATHDALTGLPNRILAFDRLDRAIAIAAREGTSAGVLFLDLDRFKNVNDSLGHARGDGLLIQVAERLRSVTRAIDTVSRQGGDEFMIIMPNASHRARFADLAEKILTALAGPYFVEGFEMSVTFSIGVSVFPNDGADAETLVKNADAAMYEAKRNGRNNFQFYAAEMNRQAVARLSLENELRHALDREEFEAYYQPKVSAADGKLTGAEALIRWNHPDKGLLGAGQFIEIAEESGLIVPIGQWITQEVCRQNQRWSQSGFSCVPISVNLSAIQFRNKTLVDSMRTILAESGLPAELLGLELTESCLMQGTEEVVDVLNELKEIGIHLSIDDFGTGYSSLSYLQRFPIDTLKIDQSFVRAIARRNGATAIIEAIISMAHSLGLAVIAEGVETAEQLGFLKAHRCNEIQGYYFSKPVPAVEFERMLVV